MKMKKNNIKNKIVRFIITSLLIGIVDFALLYYRTYNKLYFNTGPVLYKYYEGRPNTDSKEYYLIMGDAYDRMNIRKIQVDKQTYEKYDVTERFTINMKKEI